MNTTQRTARDGQHNRRGPSRARRLTALAVGLAAATQLAWTGTASATAEHPTSTPHPTSAPRSATAVASRMAAVAAMQPSWNLGNTLDAIPDETSWGNPLVTKALFDAVKAKGFRSVRIPVTWSSHQAATAPYTIDPVWMARVKQVVDWALSDGLYVDLNVHHDSWEWISNLGTDHDNVLARYGATWNQIATTFRDEPAKLLFESVNEPQFTNATDAQKTQLMDEINTSFHDVVRATGGGNATRLLMLPTLGATPSQPLMDDLSAEMNSLNDPNLVATVHYYGFWPFSVNVAGFTTFETNSQQDMDTDFAAMKNSFTSKGIPVYLGEFGLLSYPDYTKPYNTVEPGEALKYFERFGYDARTAGVTTALWDAGSFIDRNTLRWRYPTLMSQITSSWTTRSGTASADNIFVPATGAISAQTLTLNPNGTTFRSLWAGNTPLCPGRDYTVSGNQLTLTAAELTRLTSGHGYGTAATLEARFSAGTPWHVNVVSSDTPQLAGVTGSTGSVTIPTQFRGDQLATMESQYADGTPAGPINWNRYQEFGSHFAPDYSGNAITLTSDYLSTLTDGAPVTLTFDFWSGAKITYHVTRSGTTVTGAVG